MNFNYFLLDSMDLYPKMEIKDAVKHIYQSEFGGGHLITDEEASLKRLEEEYEAAAHDDTVPMFELLSKDIARANIAALKGIVSPAILNKVFIMSAKEIKGSVEEFEKKLSVLYEYFDRAETDAYLSAYKAEGYPPVSHSESYRENYSPAYRVILTKYAKFLPLFGEIDAKKPALMAIDGRCASGKTTLAAMIESVFDCNVFHTDDFFLPEHMRTEARLSSPGGNMDRERLDLEVLRPIKEKNAAVYRKYFCHDGTYSDKITVPYKPFTIVEGSYSLHPDIAHYYDYTVFINIDPYIQSKRLEEREGKDGAKVFFDRWIPLEETYFEAFDIQYKCDAVVNA